MLNERRRYERNCRSFRIRDLSATRYPNPTGCIATVPWSRVLHEHWPELAPYVRENHYEHVAIVAFCCAVVTAGMLLEDWGSWCEWLMDKWTNRKPKSEHERNWYRYLRLTFDHEPVGHRYLRTLVLRMKFELDCGGAFLVAAVGAGFTSFGSLRLVGSLVVICRDFLLLRQSFFSD